MDPRPRLLVLTDIGGDPDDQQSLVRLLVHADEFELEGIVAEHWKGDEHRITPEGQMRLAASYIEAYAAVYPRL